MRLSRDGERLAAMAIGLALVPLLLGAAFLVHEATRYRASRFALEFDSHDLRDRLQLALGRRTSEPISHVGSTLLGGQSVRGDLCYLLGPDPGSSEELGPLCRTLLMGLLRERNADEVAWVPPRELDAWQPNDVLLDAFSIAYRDGEARGRIDARLVRASGFGFQQVVQLRLHLEEGPEGSRAQGG